MWWIGHPPRAATYLRASGFTQNSGFCPAKTRSTSSATVSPTRS